jgi:hypothetical protein
MATHVGQAEKGSTLSNTFRSWIMVMLTLLFVLLYASALIGWLKPLADEKMIVRLEPIIFVIIGFYFGRLPSQENENTLKREITRQTLKADAAQFAKEEAQKLGGSLEEKVKNARATLISGSTRPMAKGIAESVGKAEVPITEDTLRQSMLAALNILNS